MARAMGVDQLLVKDLVAEIDAFVADVDTRSGDQFSHLLLGLQKGQQYGEVPLFFVALAGMAPFLKDEKYQNRPPKKNFIGSNRRHHSLYLSKMFGFWVKFSTYLRQMKKIQQFLTHKDHPSKKNPVVWHTRMLRAFGLHRCGGVMVAFHEFSQSPKPSVDAGDTKSFESALPESSCKDSDGSFMFYISAPAAVSIAVLSAWPSAVRDEDAG
jgi:hypothetical protein